jgi:outer membrane protein OmpA-like peptidoglycan-associated protein
MRHKCIPQMSQRRRLLLAAAVSSILIPSRIRVAAAQDAADINDIIKSLAPIDGQQKSGGHTPRSPKRYVVEGREVVVDLYYQRDFEIYFDYDSSLITTEAEDELRPLGRSLESPELENYSYLLAGHTDAAGSSSYNLSLSLRRAEAARDHLIRNYAIGRERLITAGFGEKQLKFPDNPRASSNRRVQVLLIVP